jgi:hypothetical protein
MGNENPKHVVTGEARLSYVHILQPYANRNNGATAEEKYSVTVLIPKSDLATMQRINAAIEAATQEGATSKWKGRPPRVATPVHDGDGQRPSDGAEFGPECKGHWVFTASCKADRKPRVVDASVQDIMDPTKVYSGVYGRVGVDFFPYDNSGKKGVGCGLTNVQILRDGEPLDNRRTAEDDFGGPAQQYAPPQPQYQPPQQGYAPQQPLPGYQAPAYAPQGYTPPQPAQFGYGYNTGAVDPITGQPIR